MIELLTRDEVDELEYASKTRTLSAEEIARIFATVDRLRLEIDIRDSTIAGIGLDHFERFKVTRKEVLARLSRGARR